VWIQNQKKKKTVLTTGLVPLRVVSGGSVQAGNPVFGFWFLVCYAATQLVTQLRQRCIRVVRSAQ